MPLGFTMVMNNQGGLNCFSGCFTLYLAQDRKRGERSSRGPPPMIKSLGVIKELLIKILEIWRKILEIWSYLFLRDECLVFSAKSYHTFGDEWHRIFIVVGLRRGLPKTLMVVQAFTLIESFLAPVEREIEYSASLRCV